MSDDNTLILDNVLWVPRHLVTEEAREAFTYRFEKVNYVPQIDLPKKCANCHLWDKKWRPGKMTCAEKGYTLEDVCKHFDPKKLPVVEEIIIKTHRDHDEDWTMFARGDLGKIERLFGEYPIQDNRSAPKLDFPLKCTRELREEQAKVVRRWLKHGYGLLKAPTGWGKTVTWAWLIAKIGLRTLLLSHETRHLSVAWEGLIEHTNIAELEEELGVHLCGVLNHDWKWDTDEHGNRYRKLVSRPGAIYPITFATYQGFGSKRGKKLRKKLKNYFGVVWCEEAHHESAATYHAVTKSFNPFYRGGQTATPTRKDQTHVAIYDTLGPVTAEGVKEQMIPRVYFHHTNILVPEKVFNHRYVLPMLCNYLARNAFYQNAVLEEIMKEIEEGRKVLLITERRHNAFSIRDKVKAHGYNAELIIGQSKMKPQDWYAKELLANRLHLIIGTKVIDENINIPPMDSVHFPFPNFVKEKEQQRVGRIRRQLTGDNLAYLKEIGVEYEKPQPRVHVYTWHSGNDFHRAASGFREKLYASWDFEFDQPPGQPQPKRRAKTMKEWLEECEGEGSSGDL
jgi:superfamily II DNA or RNA helicase